MIKEYVKLQTQPIYQVVLYDGSEESFDEIKSLCECNEAIQYNSGKGFAIATCDGVCNAKIGDYIVYSKNECLHAVKPELFKMIFVLHE